MWWCSSIVPIFHGGCFCDLCVNRNESAERFPPAFNIPLRSNRVCRYHTSSYICICSKTEFKQIWVVLLSLCFINATNSGKDYTHTCACSAGVHAAKVDNASLEICRHPCEELVGVLTEIEGLRIVTSNLLEDLERVVRQS